MDTSVTTIPVSGMHCAACIGRVQHALESTPGVNSANVNLMTGQATVDFDPRAISPEKLVDAIRSTGYGAELPGDSAPAERTLEMQDQSRAAELRELRRKAVVSLTAAVLVMLFSMPLAEVGPVAAA